MALTAKQKAAAKKKAARARQPKQASLAQCNQLLFAELKKKAQAESQKAEDQT